ncbi:hypothetical protein PTSG_03308 [Salpingoeca rosetta]|uniref:Orc1-like AAA ATPase domain-containing protein n=1 Tax=Salpingoeca rosetta (strain ATCC 50818 / BSB-021) TaxID=946362 RepID=F2U4T4_SALR5|nr:uncharacterized protein PTSG_03308 [Salpingoeca rosetta]EGD82650.1 hypothetical protein PTSG_03308 [Salpingoeca rosetta]|eukprot:XP_004995886.1 hypothetical protein PTSG_03308 [Salpingoeca rosetta]
MSCFEFEVDLLVRDVFVELRQYARANGLEVTFLLLSGQGGRFEDSPGSWQTVCDRLEEIEASDSPITLLLLTGQDWGRPLPPMVIPKDHEHLYNADHLQQFYVFDTNHDAWHLASENLDSLDDVVKTMQPPSGLEHVCRMFLTERKTKSFWIARKVASASSLAQDKVAALGRLLPRSSSGDVDAERLRRADAAHNNAAAVLPKSKRRLLEVDVSACESPGEMESAIDAYRSELRRVMFMFLQRYINAVVQQTDAGAPVRGTVDTEHHQTLLRHRADRHPMREDLIAQVIKFTNFAREMEGSPSASSFLVLHGHSCIGKSTLVAHAVRRGLVSAKGTVAVTRFIGRGCQSQRLTLRRLLHSINEELSREYRREAATAVAAIDQEIQQAEVELAALEEQAREERAAGAEVVIPEWEYETLDQLRATRSLLKYNSDTLGPAASQFQKKLQLASAKRPLFLVLCNLDRLDEPDLAEKLDWLPMELPKHVRVLITTEQGPVFDALRAHVLDPFCFVEVPDLDFVDNDTTFDKWQEKHSTTDAQGRLLLSTIQDANHPLYTQLLLAEASRWRSFDSPQRLKRQIPRSKGSPQDTLTKHVAVMCKRYPCEDIVHRILAYITFFTEHPLSETELLDVLSLDNILLDLFATHLGCTPCGRMCDAVWCDVALRLRPFLAHPGDRGVVAWCHDDIAAAARKFFLDPIVHQVASVAAEFLAGTYADVEKPLQLKPATAKAFGIDPTEPKWRGVCPQPLSFTHNDAHALLPPPNMRILDSSGELLACLGDWKSLLELYLCNFAWLEAKLAVHSPMTIVEMVARFDMSSATPVVKTTLSDLSATLQAITSENTGPVQLAKQLLLRLPVSTTPLQCLRHQAELAIGKGEGLLWPSAPLLPVAELECISVIRTPGWKCWWAGVALAGATGDKKTRATTSRLELVLVWLNAANRDMLHLYNLRTGTLFFEKELDPVLKDVGPLDVGAGEEGDSYGIAGVGIGDNMKGAAVWSNGQARVWALPAGEQLLEFQALDTVVDAVMSGDGTTLVTTNEDAYAVWDTSTGKLLCGEEGLVNVAAVAVSRDGRTAAVAKASGGVVLVDTAKASTTTFPVKTEQVVVAVALQGRSRLAVSLDDSTVIVYDIGSKKQVLSYTHPGQVESVALSANGWCASASGGDKSDRRIHLHDVGFGKRQLLVGHAADVNSVAFHPSLGECVVSASHDGTVRLWRSQDDLAALPNRHIHDDAVDFVRTSPHFAVSASATYATLHFWSHDGEWQRSVCLKGRSDEVDASCYLTGRVAVSDDGEYVVSTLADHSVCCYAWSSEKLEMCSVPNATQAQFVNNGKTTTVAVASKNALVLIDAASAEVKKRLELGDAPIRALAGLASDKYMVAAFDERLLAIDTEKGQILRQFSREAAGSELLLLQVLKRNGTPWVLSYEEGTPSVILRSLLSADEELALESNNTSCACVSADGRLVTICSNAGDVEVYDVEAGGLVLQENGAHGNAVEQCVFSADGRWLLTAGQDTLVKCWDVKAGFVLTGTEQCASPVSSLAVTQGGRGAVVGLRSGVVGHLSLVSATQSPRADVAYGESLLYNLVTTVERSTRSKAKAKSKPRRSESPSYSGSNASSATNTSARVGREATRTGRGGRGGGGNHDKKCCTLL